MNTRRDPDRLIHAFLLEGSTELADQVYVAVRDRIDHKRQRAVIGSWREPDVNRYLKIALAVAAVVVVAVFSFRQFGGANVAGPGATESPAPTVTPAVTPTPEPSASAAASLTETFTSGSHGITMSYPSGWVTRPATQPWTTGVTDFMSNAGDVLYDPALQSALWISAASQSIGDAAPAEWVAEKVAFDDGCTTTEPITVDGATGTIGSDGCTRAAVTSDGRGYFFWLYTGGEDPSLVAPYDSAWFKDFLATVQLTPPLAQTFTSPLNGFSVSYPEGWTARAATEPWTDDLSGPATVDPHRDLLQDPVLIDHLFLWIASQPIGEFRPRGLGRCAVRERGMHDNAAGRDRRRHGTHRRRGLRRSGRHNRWPRVRDRSS